MGKRVGILSLTLLAILACAGAATAADEKCAADRECSDGLFCNGSERCNPGDPRADRFGCLPATARPCRGDEECIEAEARCKPPCRYPEDGDRDGSINVLCGGDDCDDRDPNRFPGNPEVCDERGHDEDCDPTTFGFKDEDNDTFVDVQCWNPRF